MVSPPASSIREVAPRTQTDYYNAAFDLLASDGPRALTIAKLCHALGVSKGSFYHHFDGIPDFTAKFLDYWEHWESADVEVMLEKVEPVERLQLAKIVATWEIHHEAETAIRAMARTNPEIGAVMRRVDDKREDVIFRVFVTVGMEEDRARVLARLGIAVLVGTQSREHPVDRNHLREMFDEYHQWLLHVASLPAPN